MSFDVTPLRPLGAASAERPGRGPARSDQSFAEATTAVPSAPPIPEEVWDQVDAAARLAEDLHAQGRGVRFDVHKLDGGVVANLVDDEGSPLRPLLLGEVVDVDRLAYELSKENR